MWISRRKFDELIKRAYEEGREQGFQQGQRYAVMKVYRWRRRFKSELSGILVDQINEILKKKGVTDD